MLDLTNDYSIIDIIYISYLLLVGLYYNYINKSIKRIIKHYLYFIIFHILYKLYIHMDIVIKYIFYQTFIAIIIISLSFMFIKILVK
jgi:hypothetical protein